MKATNVNIDVIEEVLVNYPNWSLYDKEGTIILPFRKNDHDIDSYDYLIERLESLGNNQYIIKIPKYNNEDFNKLAGSEISAAYRVNSMIYRFKYPHIEEKEHQEELHQEPRQSAPSLDFKSGNINIMSILQFQSQQQQFFLEQERRHSEQAQKQIIDKMEEALSNQRNLHDLEMQLIRERYEREQEEEENTAISGLNSLDRTDLLGMFNTAVETIKGILNKAPAPVAAPKNDLIEKLNKYLPGTVEELEKTIHLAESDPEKFKELINQQSQNYDEFTEQ